MLSSRELAKLTQFKKIRDLYLPHARSKYDTYLQYKAYCETYTWSWPMRWSEFKEEWPRIEERIGDYLERKLK